jgi:L-malate glycosyltransferase
VRSAVRVVLVNHTSTMSGAEVSLLDLVDGLTAGHDVTLAAPEGALASAVRTRGAAVEVIPAVEGSLRLDPRQTPATIAAIAASALAIRQVARRARADVIHVNSFRAGLSACLAAVLGAPRPLVHLHDCLPATAASRATEQILSAGAARILANSAYTAACFNGGRSRAPLSVVHNPIDLDRFDPARVDRAEARAELGLAPDRTVLTVLAQITPWKGQDTAIQAVHLLRERGRHVELLIAGTIKFRRPATRYDNEAFLRKLEETVRTFDLEDVVKFTGECADVPRLLRAVDCVLVPSWAEPWGRVVVEAMAMTTPVVATSLGGTAELIDHGRDGLLAPPHDPAAWADAVEHIMDDGALRERLVEAGRATARRFDRDTYVEQVLKAYRATTERM